MKSKECKQITNKQEYILFAVMSVITGLFCLGTSPLIHAMGTDSEVFYMMGKGMVDGKVAYRELFDHKGLYLYFFNAMGVAIDAVFGVEIGVCLVEMIFIFANLCCVYKLCVGIGLECNFSVISTLIFLALSQNYFTAQGGNCVETYAMTFQLIALVFMYRIMCEESEQKIFWYMMIQGACSGICLFIRANLVIMWIPFGIYLFMKLLKEKKEKVLVRALFGLLAGVALSAVPVMAYGLYYSCIEEMYFAMFSFNLKYVALGASGANIGVYLSSILKNPIVLVLAISVFGTISVLVDKKFGIGVRLMYVGMVLVSALSILSTGMIRGHYYQYMIPFCIPAIIMIVVFCRKCLSVAWEKPILRCLGIAVVLFGTLLVNGRIIIRTVLYEQSETYRFEQITETCAEYVRKSGVDNPDLLVTGNVVGFYHAVDIIPENQYFYIPSIIYEIWGEPVDAQAASILNGDTEFVVVGYYKSTDSGEIYGVEEIDQQLVKALSGYRLLYESDVIRDRQYCLYQKAD